MTKLKKVGCGFSHSTTSFNFPASTVPTALFFCVLLGLWADFLPVSVDFTASPSPTLRVT